MAALPQQGAAPLAPLMRISDIPASAKKRKSYIAPLESMKDLSDQENGKLALLTSGRRAFQQRAKRAWVVIPPQPCTFRKCCAQSEKTATSPNCKKITQPSGAATPRDSDTHKRIAVPQALCVFRECLRPRLKSGKVCRSDTRPGDVRERAARVEGSDSAPHPKRSLFRRVCPCVRSFEQRRVCTRFHL